MFITNKIWSSTTFITPEKSRKKEKKKKCFLNGEKAWKEDAFPLMIWHMGEKKKIWSRYSPPPLFLGTCKRSRGRGLVSPPSSTFGQFYHHACLPVNFITMQKKEGEKDEICFMQVNMTFWKSKKKHRKKYFFFFESLFPFPFLSPREDFPSFFFYPSVPTLRVDCT